jgi:prefoldin subunit 5
MADIKKELSGEYDGKIKELSDRVDTLTTENTGLKAQVKEFSEAEDRIKTLSEADSRELATPEGFMIDIDSEGNVCRVI